MKKLFTLLTMLIVGIGSSWATVITEQLTLSPNNGANLIKADGTTVNFGTDAYGSRWGGAVSGIPVSILSANNADVVGTFSASRFQFKNNGNNKFYIKVPDCFTITAYTFTAVHRSSDWGYPTFYEGDNTTGTTINSSYGITVNNTASFTAGSSFYFYVKHASNDNAALTMNENTFKITISFDIDALKTRAEELYAMRGTSGYPADGVNVTTNLKNAIDAITGESSTKTAANCYVLYQAINAYIPFNTTSPDVISINFGSNERVFTGTGGIVSVGNWNNCADKINTDGFSLNKSDGTSSGATVKWSCKNTWSYKTNVTDDWLVGYLDDGNEISVEVSGIPYNQYSLIIYQATDTENYGFNPPAINGVYYSWDGRLVSKTRNDTNLKYGTSQNATASLGTNTIKLKGLSGRLIIKGGGNTNKSARGCIAGIQIVKETELSTVITEQQTSNITTIPEYIEYAGGAGTSGSRVSINHNGGSVKLTGAEKTYYLTGSNSGTQTTVNFDGTTVNYNNELGIGTAIYNINNTQITTPKFITSQGNPGRSAVVNLTGNSVITVTGNSNVDSNQSSIMIGHWNGSSNVTLSGTAKIDAADAQLLIGKTGNTQTITLNGSSNIKAKGIKVSSGADGTNTLNLNGGSLNLGDVGITSYSSSRSIAVNVNENTTITATAATLPLTQPITVASGKTLTIDGGTNNAEITLPSSLTNNGTIHFKDATPNLTKRDFSELSYTFNNCTAQFVETGDEYKAGGFTITNIPAGLTIKVKKYDATEYETVTPVDGTATISHSVGVSGYAAWMDYTFNESTKDKNTGTSGNVIKNAGNAGESGNNLNLDSSNGHQYTPSNSYNEDGTLKVESTPYRSVTWPSNYTVAVAGNVPDVENGCLVAFGTLSGGYLAIVRGDANNKILLVKGKGQTPFTVITEMTAANATALSHLVVFTKNGNTFTVYLDGVQKTQVTYSETLGNGLQIGSLHGGINNTGIVRVSYMDDATAKAKVFAKAVRVYNYVISADQMSQLKEEFPYVSFGGTYSRTISANGNLSASNAWLNKGSQGNVDVPVNAVVDEVTYYPDVEVTTTAASTLTVNADMDTENIKFDGTGKLTIASDGEHNIHIYGSLTANGPVSVKYGETNLSAVPVTIGESGSVEFDFSAYDFSEVVTPTDIPVTGNTSDYGSKVTARYPESDTYRSFSLAHNGVSNRYVLTVTPAREEAQTVYAPAGTTQITDGMYVKMSAEAETNDGLLIPGDHLIINNNTETLIFNQTSGFCTFEIQGGATVTVNNKTAEGYALDGETITITNGTLKLNYGNGDAKINSATINVSENGTLDNYGWLTVDGTLTVNSNFDKTILNNSGAENPSQTRGTGKIVKGGTGTITMRAMPHCTENEVTTKHPIEITGGTLILSDGAKAGAITGSGTLKVPAATSISVASMVTGSTLEGSGYITMTAFQRSNVPTLTNWTGTIAITNADVSGPFSIDNLVNGNNSLVRMSHIQGWIAQNSTTNANIVLDNDDWTYGFNVTGVNSGAYYTFTGDFSGSGDFMYRQSDSESRNATFNFSGDLSEWTGKFNLKENGEGTTNVKVTSTDNINAGFANTATKANTLKVTFESSEAQNIKGEISNSNTGNGSLVLKLLGTGAKTISANIDVSRLKVVKADGAEITINGNREINVGQLDVYTDDNNTAKTSLNIIMSTDDITAKIGGNASCALIDVADGGAVNATGFTINGAEMVTIGDYAYYINHDESTNDIVLVKHYTRSVTSGNFGSICIENGASVSQMTGVAKVLKVTEITTDRVVMDEVDEMVAGVPYIFKSNDAAINLTLKGETVADAVNDECEDNPNGYLVGNFEPTGVPNSNSDADYNYYILQSNQFKKVTSGTIKSGKNRCYLKVSKVGLSRQATLGIAVDDGGATGIDAINSLMNNDAEIYDLNGRRLNDLRKGINIVNGVKVIVK